MDEYIGKSGFIADDPLKTGIVCPKGILIYFDGDSRLTPYRFPWFVLAKCMTSPTATATATDTATDTDTAPGLIAFQFVLVKQGLSDEWKPEFFWKFISGEEFPYRCVSRSSYRYCVPYRGNERLLGAK